MSIIVHNFTVFYKIKTNPSQSPTKTLPEERSESQLFVVSSVLSATPQTGGNGQGIYSR